MNSKSPLTAIVKRIKVKAAIGGRLEFGKAVNEIADALHIKDDAATMTLYGLCATGNVRWLDGEGEIVDEDKCTIAAFNRKPEFVIASDVRYFLTDWSPTPQRSGRESVIAALIVEGLNPPHNIDWKSFCKRVRDRCKGWRAKDKPALGFSDKQIQRCVNGLRGK